MANDRLFLRLPQYVINTATSESYFLGLQIAEFRQKNFTKLINLGNSILLQLQQTIVTSTVANLPESQQLHQQQIACISVCSFILLLIFVARTYLHSSQLSSSEIKTFFVPLVFSRHYSYVHSIHQLTLRVIILLHLQQTVFSQFQSFVLTVGKTESCVKILLLIRSNSMHLQMRIPSTQQSTLLQYV